MHGYRREGRAGLLDDDDGAARADWLSVSAGRWYQRGQTYPFSFSTRSMVRRTWLGLGDAKTLPHAAAVCAGGSQQRAGWQGGGETHR